MEKHHKHTGENYPKNFDGDLSKFNKEASKQEKEALFEIGLGVIIVYVLFAILLAAVMALDNKNDELKAKLSKQADLEAKIAEQQILIRDLKTVLSDDLKMHHNQFRR